MSRVLVVAQREFLATVRTKAFLISTIFMPLIIFSLMFGGEWITEQGQQTERALREIAVVDRTGALLPALRQEVAEHNEQWPNQPLALVEDERDASGDELAERVRAGELYAYLIVSEDALSPAGGGCEMGRRDNQVETGQRLERMVNDAVFAVRCERAGLDAETVKQLDQRVPLQWVDVMTGATVAGGPEAQLLVAYAFMFLLFMGTFGISQGLLTSLIEEKSSRVIEVLLSATSPTQLLAGKILGTALVGFLLIGVWGSLGYMSAQSYNVGELVSPSRLTLAFLYFVPGFLLISSLLAGIGAAVNELKEAQSMVFPLSLMMMVPLVFGGYIAEYPSTAAVLVLSFVPPITPFVMMLRVCADPDTPVWQIVATLVVLWASVFIAMWVAGKVFRIGVLMYGKPPSLAELARWVRYA